MLAVAGVVNLAYLITRSDPVYPLVYVWACLAIHTNADKRTTASPFGHLTACLPAYWVPLLAKAHAVAAAAAAIFVLLAGDDHVVNTAALAGVVVMLCADAGAAVLFRRQRQQNAASGHPGEGSNLLPS
jgi:hypothetical protein